MVTATPTRDSDIKVEVWLPDAWNGKLLGIDNGGFSGAINYAALAAAVTKGYAAVSTDTGHTGDQMDFGIGHPEKIVDWAYRSVHEMTTIAKTVVERVKGRAPARSYFSGCSTGGQQALSEAQRYPADYDGIVGGDPGNNRINLIYGFLWSWLATHDTDGTPILPSAKLPALAKAAVAACDKNDGLEDGLIGDPRACRFDPSVLACKGDETDALPDAAADRRGDEGVCRREDEERTAAVPRLGPRQRSRMGHVHHESEGAGPHRVVPQLGVSGPVVGSALIRLGQGCRHREREISVPERDGDRLRAFQSRGGKLIMYTGLADPVTSPLDTFAYYESVAKAMGGIDATKSFYRFFPAPGMAHCGGGAGPNTFDALAALDAWVEKGTAPDSIPASHATNGQVDRTRPLCAYPAVAHYSGAGSIDDAANFSCAVR